MSRTALPILAVVFGPTVKAQLAAMPPDVRAAVRAFVAAADSAALATTRVAVAPLPNAGASRGAYAVYLVGDVWCGTGGCRLLVLAPAAAGYRPVAEVGIVQLPIRALATAHDGWPDLAVNVCGGGILRCYRSRLRYDGRSYPSNPSLTPRTRSAGRVLIGRAAAAAAARLSGEPGARAAQRGVEAARVRRDARPRPSAPARLGIIAR